MASRGKKKFTPLLIPSIRFTKQIIHHLKTKHNIHPRTGSPLHYSHEDNVLGTFRPVAKDGREVFGMTIPDALLTDAIKKAPYYGGYLAHVAEYQRYLDEKCGMAEEEAVPESPKATKVTKPKAAMQTKPSAPKATKVTKPAGDKAPKPTSSQPPKPTLAPTKSSKEVQGKKRNLVKETSDAPSPTKRSKAGKVTKKRKSKSPLRLVDEFVDEGVPDKEPAYNDEEANFQRAVELSLKEQEERTQGPARLVVFREHDFGRFQLLSETLKKKTPADQFMFQRRTPMTIEPSGNAECPSLDVELSLVDSETESDEPDISMAKDTEMEVTHTETPVMTTGVQDEGQAESNPGKQDEGQARSNPGNATEFQPQPSHVVHVGPNLEPMDLAENLKLPTEDQVILKEPASSTRTLSSLQNLEKELSFTDQFFVEKPQEEEPEKTNAESEVQSMVTVPIHQDTSLVPPMTTPVIDLTTSQSDSPTVHAPLPTSTAITTTITTTTTLPPPPLQPRQSTTDPILLQHIGELEQHMANLIQDNSVLEERLNKHGSRLYNLENLNIPQKVSKAVDEIVTDAVDWALQAPLRARFRDLPEADMKEILLQ
ncbi:E-beta-farnesene synthase [Tanacetum coccineum]